MNARWIGAIFVLFSCGGFGFSIAHSYRQRERLLHQLLAALEMMASELEYRLTPLPELARKAAKDTSGVLRDVFLNLARELDWQSEPDAGSCMRAAMDKCHDLPTCLRRPLRLLGQTLDASTFRDSCRDLSLYRMPAEGKLPGLRTTGMPDCAAIRRWGSARVPHW